MAKSAQNEINPQSPNAENSVEMELATIKIWEVCPDWSNIGETDKQFLGN